MFVARRSRALVAAANSIQHKVLKSVVGRAGYEAVPARNTDEALNILDDGLGGIRLIIVDMDLDGGDALDVVRVTRYLDPEHRIGVIVRSEQPDEHDKIMSIAAGADACVPTSSDASDLLGTIWNLDSHVFEDALETALAV